jgi:hypothetical protein
MVTWLCAGAAVNTAHANKIVETVFFMNLSSFPNGSAADFPISGPTAASPAHHQFRLIF